MVIFIKKAGLRVGLNNLNKYIPGRGNYKEQRRKSVFVNCHEIGSHKKRGKIELSKVKD